MVWNMFKNLSRPYHFKFFLRRPPGVFIVNFEHISYHVLLFLLLTLNLQLPAGRNWIFTKTFTDKPLQQYRHCANGLSDLIGNKEISLNICMFLFTKLLIKIPFEKGYVPFPSFAYRKIWTSISVKNSCFVLREFKGALSGLRQLKALQKWWKMLFISSQKLFSFSRYLSFCFDFLVM